MAETDASARTSEPAQATAPVMATETAAGTVPTPMAEEGAVPTPGLDYKRKLGGKEGEEAMLPMDAEQGRAGVGGEGEEETAETGSRRPHGDGEGNGSGITQTEVHEPETSEVVNGEVPVDESMLCSSQVDGPKECSELPQEGDVPSPEQQSDEALTQEVTRKTEIPQSKVDVGDSSTLAARSFGTPQSGAEQVDIHVPNDKAELVIGEGGETIKALKTKSGADTQLIPGHLPEGDLCTERKIRLTGNWNQIEIARTMVLELISQFPRSSSQMGGHKPGRAPQWGSNNGHDYPGGMYYQNPQYLLDGVYSEQTASRGGMDTGWNQMSGGGTGQAPYQGGCYDYYASYNTYSARGPPSGVQAPMYDSVRGPTGAQAPIHYGNWSPQAPVGYTSSYRHSAPGQLTCAQGYNGQFHGQQSVNSQTAYQSYPPQQDPYGKSAFGGAQQGNGIPMPGTNYRGPTPAQQPYAL
ncbi:far upstream element-binding protein 1-like [Triticum aestivum]|uniref:far upstream element-binding protein 1-like n=1 Tax=Triticum aestivum TaxID=4565 RepID=UPI001D012D7B|nr:far upstream element-binding protein 1-like [Triticum aestivum]